MGAQARDAGAEPARHRRAIAVEQRDDVRRGELDRPIQQLARGLAGPAHHPQRGQEGIDIR